MPQVPIQGDQIIIYPNGAEIFGAPLIYGDSFMGFICSVNDDVYHAMLFPHDNPPIFAYDLKFGEQEENIPYFIIDPNH